MILIVYTHRSLLESLNKIDFDLRMTKKHRAQDTRHNFLGTPNIHMRPSGMFLYSHLRSLDANPNVELVIVVSFRASCHKWDRSG